LKSDASLKVHVVGHTDNVGGLDANMKLSRDRADAVVQALVRNHGIIASRLNTYGDGPYAPVASNDTEEGKAKNRRVELVKQ
jgi:OOP family OmpA-OmpF porin